MCICCHIRQWASDWTNRCSKFAYRTFRPCGLFGQHGWNSGGARLLGGQGCPAPCLPARALPCASLAHTDSNIFDHHKITLAWAALPQVLAWLQRKVGQTKAALLASPSSGASFGSMEGAGLTAYAGKPAQQLVPYLASWYDSWTRGSWAAPERLSTA